MKNKVYLLTGSNVGDRLQYLHSARHLIESNIGNIITQSSVYETQAWGNRQQGHFYNQAILAETQLDAKEILNAILSIEKQIGRIRQEKWEPRKIDIDILFFNEEIIESDELKIPHPFLHLRKFTLVPLAEISPSLFHPKLKKNISQLLAECKDDLAAEKIRNGT